MEFKRAEVGGSSVMKYLPKRTTEIVRTKVSRVSLHGNSVICLRGSIFRVFLLETYSYVGQYCPAKGILVLMIKL